MQEVNFTSKTNRKRRQSLTKNAGSKAPVKQSKSRADRAKARQAAKVANTPKKDDSRDDEEYTGWVVNNRWVVVEKLASGGFGAVYKARDKETRDFVAVKTVCWYCWLLILGA